MPLTPVSTISVLKEGRLGVGMVVLQLGNLSKEELEVTAELIFILETAVPPHQNIHASHTFLSLPETARFLRLAEYICPGNL